MPTELLTFHAARITHSVQRARAEYAADPTGFAQDISRQDAAIFNIQRACAAALDMGQYLIHQQQLGVPQNAREVFSLLAKAGWLDTALAEGLQRLSDFRDLALHDDQAVLVSDVVSIITGHLDEFLHYSEQLLKRDATGQL